jgi:hypothetical protein
MHETLERKTKGVMDKRRGRCAAPCRRRFKPLGLEATSAAKATTVTAIATETAAAGGATSRTTIVARTGFIHGDGAATEIGAVQLFDRRSGAGVFHFNKTKALGLSGHAVGDDVDGRDVTELGEGITQFVLGRLERKVADINIFHKSRTPNPTRRRNVLENKCPPEGR